MVIKTYSVNGAAVSFCDDAYKNAAEAELECRRENLLKIAAQTAQEQDLRLHTQQPPYSADNA